MSNRELLEDIELILSDEIEMFQNLESLIDLDVKILNGSLRVLLRELSYLSHLITKHLYDKKV